MGAVVYLAIVFGVMLWRGIEIEPEFVAFALLVLAIAMGRGRQFVFDFLPFLLLFFAYEVMRGFAGSTGFAPHDIGRLEQWVFRGNLPTVWLQRHLYNPARIGLLDWITITFYFLHFVLPLCVGFYFWTRDREHFWRYVAALLFMSFIAFLTFLFFPSAPPWYQYPHLVHKISNETVQKWGIGYTVVIYQHLNPNQFAAFPSLHAAYPTLAMVYAFPRYPKFAAFLALWSLCVFFSVVYLGEHYVVDILLALVYVAVATITVEWVWRRAGGRIRPTKSSA
ncbi:MAG TPA: phosphatase PAP2 family protein [Candidatus Nitrosotalea sp.]|nr:phosphatase PAP2 family protein [Candidatus Nitrosotalea sp.]